MAYCQRPRLSLAGPLALSLPQPTGAAMADAVVRCGMAAPVALKARAGAVDDASFDDLLRSTVFLPFTHPLSAAVHIFADAFRQCRHDPAAIADLGEALQRAVDVATRIPDTFVPVDIDRKDIHG